MKEQLKDLIKLKGFNIDDYDECHGLYEALDYDGSLHMLIDGMIDLVYYDLRKWAVDNYDKIEAAVDEGLVDLSSDFDFHKLIQIGQYVAYSEQCNEELEELFSELKEVANA